MSARNTAKPDAMRPTLEADAEAARQQAARDLLNIEKVKLALLAKAKEGLKVCVFRPAKALDLRNTEAADALEQWAKQQDLSFEWGPAETVSEAGFDVGAIVPLAIRWGTARLKAEPT